MSDPWVSCVHEGSLKGLRWREGDKACDTHFEFLVPLQNLRAQCDVVHRPLVIVVNDIAAFPPILALVSRLGPRLALALVHGLQAWRLCQLYALQAIKVSGLRPGSEVKKQQWVKKSSEDKTCVFKAAHCVDPKAGLRRDHDHPS